MKIFFTFFLFWIGFFGLHAQNQTLGFVMPEGKTKIVIPFQVYNNLVVIPVILNGQIPLRFILDTGVRTAILTERTFSDILQLPYSRQYIISGPGGEKLINAYVTNNVSLMIPPNFKGEGHSMLVLEKDYLELRNLIGYEVHGIIGYEIFSRFVVKIDYEHKQLTLFAPKRFKPKRSFSSVPITIEDTKPFLVTDCGLVKGVNKLKLMIDTGASHCLLLDPESSSAIEVPVKFVKGAIGHALGGEITGKIGRIDFVQLGKYRLEKPIVNFPDPNSYIDTLRTTAIFRHGTIGGEVLSRFTIIFDYPQGKLYIKKNATFKSGLQFNMSGLTVRAKGAKLNVFEIDEVRVQSAGQKNDFKVGDILLTINGTTTSSLNLNDINAILNSKSGRKLVIEVNREGVRIKKNLVLENEI